MIDNVDTIRHGRVTQHADVRRERFRPNRPAVGAVLFDVKVSSSSVRESLTSSSRRHEFYAASLNGLEIQLDVAVHDVYLGGPSDTSLLCLYVDHATRHV